MPKVCIILTLRTLTAVCVITIHMKIMCFFNNNKYNNNNNNNHDDVYGAVIMT